MADKDTKEFEVPAILHFGEADYNFETQTFIPRPKIEGTVKLTLRTNITALSDNGGEVYETFTKKRKKG